MKPVEPAPIGEIIKLPQYIHHSAVAVGTPHLGIFTPKFTQEIASCLGSEYAAYWHTKESRWYALRNGEAEHAIDITHLWRKMYQLIRYQS
jgi:hypothetical protein